MVLITTTYHKLPSFLSPWPSTQLPGYASKHKQAKHIPNAVQVLSGMKESEINNGLSS